jgi:eukaryotic-like serine/threonine-protein kinase
MTRFPPASGYRRMAFAKAHGAGGGIIAALLALSPGTRLGFYEITAQIGEGGMGQVYRATDTKLKRQVAIKILSSTLAVDADQLARFQREAEVLASLNHPNIGGIYGLEETNGVMAIVLELVEGEDLAQRIARGAIPLDDALPIARQIAEAVAAAHEHGIIHRDLKPANVKVRDDGTVKVLDFGLAKALPPPGVSSGVSQSPTITTPAMTKAGVILGTAAYMAPEQAKGKPADKRSDVWAFGCVLYEMLAGKRAFEGDDVSDTLAAILRGDPDWTALPADVPLPIRTLLVGCLAKDRRHRVADLSAALFVIHHQSELASPRQAMASAQRVPLWRKAIPVAAVAIVALAAGYAGWLLKRAAPRAVTRLTVPLGEGEAFTPPGPAASLALTPDATRLAYTANARLYVRALDQLDAALIAGVEARGLSSARAPFFSPDGRWLGFWESGHLKKVSVSGAAPVTLCALAAPPFGATWTADNTILFGNGPDGIWQVSGDGGNPERIIAVEAGQRAHGPQVLPDGRTVLFTLARTASWDDAQIVVQSLDNGTRQILLTGGTDARYLPTGHLVYALRGSLLAVPFDVTSLSIKGTAVPLVEGVWRPAAALNPAAQFAVSSDGTLAYVPTPTATAAVRTLVWVDRQGREEAIPAQPQVYRYPRIAPDGTRLAVEIEDHGENRDIWIWDFERATWTRITSDPSVDSEPAWTPDGQGLIFSSWRTGLITLFRQAANGTGTAERVRELSRQNVATPAMSPDGKHVVVRGSAGESADLMILDLDGESAAEQPSSGIAPPRKLIQTPFEEYNAAFSPDGRWLAYQADTSGSFEVYVRPFPDVNSNLWLVSTAGGTEPVWARDGRELFYRSPRGAVMRVPISAGTSLKAGPPTRLFETPSYVFEARGQRSYDVAPDGKRFVMLKNTDPSGPRATPPRIIVVQNWFEELKRLVPTK